MKAKQTKEGCWWKGKFIEAYAGCQPNVSEGFNRGGLPGLSRTLKADTEAHAAGVCVEYYDKTNNDMSKYLRITGIELVQRIIPDGSSGGTGYCEYDVVKVSYDNGKDETIWVPAYYNSLNEAWEELYKKVESCANPEEAYELLRGAIGNDVRDSSFGDLRESFKSPIPIPTKKGRKIYRIRKLTSRECFRLMGVSDSDINKIKEANISESQQYKMAGNSIVVQVLEGIFTQMFRKDSDALF